MTNSAVAGGSRNGSQSQKVHGFNARNLVSRNPLPATQECGEGNPRTTAPPGPPLRQPQRQTALLSPTLSSLGGGEGGDRAGSGIHGRNHRFGEISRNANNAFLRWNSQSGSTYRVIAKETITQTIWTNVSGTISASGPTTSWTAANVSSRPQRVFKMVSP